MPFRKKIPPVAEPNLYLKKKGQYITILHIILPLLYDVYYYEHLMCWSKNPRADLESVQKIL